MLSLLTDTLKVLNPEWPAVDSSGWDVVCACWSPVEESFVVGCPDSLDIFEPVVTCEWPGPAVGMLIYVDWAVITVEEVVCYGYATDLYIVDVACAVCDSSVGDSCDYELPVILATASEIVSLAKPLEITAEVPGYDAECLF